MPNAYFQFKEFRIDQNYDGLKVTTDACLFGAWVSDLARHNKSEPNSILDIGTGTGLLSLMLAQKTHKSVIHAIEIVGEVANKAQSNFEGSDWFDRLKVHHTDIADFEPHHGFDWIVANPPFFESSLKGTNQVKNTAIHTGRLDQQEVADNIERLLNPHGSAFVLYPEREMEQFSREMSQRGFYPKRNIEVYNRPDTPIFRVMTQFVKANKPLKPAETHLIIKRTDNRYTDEFWKLVSDYYLEYNNPSQKP